MTQLQLFKNDPPSTSCRRFWDRPQPGNEFSLAWQAGEIDFEALARHLQEGQRRAARAGKKEALSFLCDQADWLADQLARRDPRFDLERFEVLLQALAKKLESANK